MKEEPSDSLLPVLHSIPGSGPYPTTPNSYMSTPPNYYPHAHAPGVVHDVNGPSRSEHSQRKRPKYTRSKTGCMTCRVKKIKCDETKPICMRCTHGQRDCTWPEGVSTRKKPTPKKDSTDGRPSTAESSGISETSTPPTRDSTPPCRQQNEYVLPPVSRRHSEPFVPSLGPDPDPTRRQLTSHGYPSLHHPTQTGGGLSTIHEMSTYPPSQPRYDPTYTSASTVMHVPPPRMVGPSQGHQLQMRPATQHHVPQHHWAQSHMLPALNLMEPFYHTPQERNLVGHSSNDHHPRYQ